MKNIILASSSPRRMEIMNNNGYYPKIIPADVDETLPFAMNPKAATMYLAYKKADFVLNTAESDINTIIAADTIVVYNNIIIGKPKNRDDAFNTLCTLKGKAHHVITGVCILDTKKNIKECFNEDTTVFFKDYNNRELIDYINTSEPYDKAGGYAIQGTFKKYIDHIEGDFDNVVGFPWSRIKEFL